MSFAQNEIQVVPVIGGKIYAGLDNRICLIGEAVNYNKLTLATNNGVIRHDTLDYYNFKPLNEGSATIYFSQISNISDTHNIGKVTVVVSALPTPEIMLKFQREKIIGKEQLIYGEGLPVGIRIPQLPLDVRYGVKSFTILLIRDSKVIYSEKTNSYRFSQNLVDQFKGLKIGDNVVFKEIIAYNSKTGKIEQVSPEIYTIGDL
jgi:hypothetical protein